MKIGSGSDGVEAASSSASEGVYSSFATSSTGGDGAPGG